MQRTLPDALLFGNVPARTVEKLLGRRLTSYDIAVLVHSPESHGAIVRGESRLLFMRARAAYEDAGWSLVRESSDSPGVWEMRCALGHFCSRVVLAAVDQCVECAASTDAGDTYVDLASMANVARFAFNTSCTRLNLPDTDRDLFSNSLLSTEYLRRSDIYAPNVWANYAAGPADTVLGLCAAARKGSPMDCTDAWLSLYRAACGQDFAVIGWKYLDVGRRGLPFKPSYPMHIAGGSLPFVDPYQWHHATRDLLPWGIEPDSWLAWEGDDLEHFATFIAHERARARALLAGSVIDILPERWRHG